MKQAVFAIVAFASAISMASAGQVNPSAERKHVTFFDRHIFAPSVIATAIRLQPPVIQYSGNVEIRTKDMVLRADEVKYNQNTREFEAHGTVRIKLKAQ